MSAASKIVTALRAAGRPMTEEELAAATGLRPHDVERGLEVLTATMAARPQAIAAWVLVSSGSLGIPSWQPVKEETTVRHRKVNRRVIPGGRDGSKEVDHPMRVAAAKKAWETRRRTVSEETRKKISESQKRRWAAM